MLFRSRQPRTAVVTVTDRYLHAEARSLLFRFTDDLEFLLQPDVGRIDVRSASRVGHSDLGVNKARTMGWITELNAAIAPISA